MSDPFTTPGQLPPEYAPGAFRRISARPIERLSEAKALVGEQYWLFVGICLVGLLIMSFVPLGIMNGPMLCGMYLCFSDRLSGFQTRFERLFKGFDHFGESLVAWMIIFVLILVAMIPGILLMLAGMMAAAAMREPGVMVLVWVVALPCIILMSTVIYVPFMFVFPLIVDRRMTAWDAVKTSASAAWANFAPLCLLLFVHYLLSMIGSCFCYVPAVLLLPLVVGAAFLAYREIFAGQIPASPPPPEVRGQPQW